MKHTVTSWFEHCSELQEFKQRYFKGAAEIIQMAHLHCFGHLHTTAEEK
jgi:hypothetical protein